MKKKNNWRYHPFTQVYQKSWSCALQFLRYGTKWMQLLFFILGYFCPFTYKQPKKWKFHTSEKKFLEMSSFYKSAPKIIVPFINFIFHFGLFFAFSHFIPKKENFKKIKKMSGGIIIFYKCTKNHNYMLGLFFCVFTTLAAQKMNFSKKWKKCQRYHFMQVYQKTWSYDILFPGYVMGQM